MSLSPESTELKKANIEQGEICWKSPSNLAIIKYWGKFGTQFPRNPSISFTLDNAHTITTLAYTKKETTDEAIQLEFLFHGEENEAFKIKLVKFLEKIKAHFPFIIDYNLKISSQNSFPHSSGIASSASSMSALALCLCSMSNAIYGKLNNKEEFFRKASYIARLGSGSASRSVYSGLALWGQANNIVESSNDYAIPYGAKVHPQFLTFHDDILIVSKKEKSVSSTAGHALMDNNVFAEVRYNQAENRLEEVLKAMTTGDIESFGKICEDEALTLHALMMCSDPSYILIEPQTLQLIKEIRGYRKETKHPVYFSLDAGPNIHLLYPDSISKEIKSWQEQVLSSYCLDILHDQVGSGPQNIST